MGTLARLVVIVLFGVLGAALGRVFGAFLGAVATHLTAEADGPRSAEVAGAVFCAALAVFLALAIVQRCRYSPG